MEDLFQTAITTALGVESDDFIKSLKDESGEFKPDAQKIVLDKLSGHIGNLTQQVKTKEEEKAKNLINKAIKTTSEKWEGSLKGFIGDQEVEGAEGFKQAISELLNKKVDPGEYNFKTDPKFITYDQERETLFNQQKNEAIQEWEQKYNGLQSEVKNKEVFKVLDAEGRNYWSTRKPDFQDETIKENQYKYWLQRVVEQGRFDVIDGKAVLLNEEGEVKKNELGHTVSVSSIFQKNFDGFIPEVVQGGKGTPGLGKGDNAYKGAMPKTMAEADAIINDRTIPLAERKSVRQYAADNNLK